MYNNESGVLKEYLIFLSSRGW